MGTIVIVKKKSEIAIASDCCNVRDAALRNNINISHGCIVRFGESFVGLSSSVGFQQVFEELLNGWAKPLPALSSREEIRAFFQQVHDILKHRSGMFVAYQQGQEFEWTPMNALVGNASGIYKVDSTRAVYEFTKFWALGSGEPLALGAMAAVFDRVESADEIARVALAAVATLEIDGARKMEVLSTGARNVLSGPQLVESLPVAKKPVKGTLRALRPRRALKRPEH